MNFREQIAAIDVKKADIWQNAFWDFEDIGQELGIYNLYDADTSVHNHIKEFPLHTWQCTDTMVGWNALFLNEEFICITFQQGRKCDVHYFWASKEAIENTRSYLIGAIPKKEQGYNILSEKDLDFDPVKNTERDRQSDYMRYNLLP